MKKFLLTSLILLFAQAISAQIKVSILGDSYSTFENWVPAENDAWYGADKGNDVKDVGLTWWHELIENNGLKLEVNNSWSGATICNTGYNGEDYTHRSFLTRAGSLGSKPDIIYVFGGTNDSWANSPIGDFDESDMFAVRPAAKAMLQKIKATYPEALCLVIINTELSGNVENAIVKACELEDVPYVKLEEIDKQYGHPSKSGMHSIALQVWKATAPLLYSKLMER